MAKVELDYMEYATDGTAQAAYVSSDTVTNNIVDQQQPDLTEGNREIYGSVDGDTMQKAAQSFIPSGNITVYSVHIGIKQNGTPTDSIVVRIETDSSNVPSGTLVNANATKTIASASLVDGLNEFVFTSTFSLSASTTYWIVVSRNGTRSTTNYWLWWAKNNSYANGIEKYYSSSSWSAGSSYDNAFKVTAAVPHLQCYSESTIKTQGSYSLKAVALATDSLNDTLTRTLGEQITQSQLLNNTAGVTFSPYNDFDGGGTAFQVQTTDPVTKFVYKLTKLGTPTGTLTGYIYSDDGAGKPNTALATFSNMAVADVSTSATDYAFTGTFTPTANTTYHAIVLGTSLSPNEDNQQVYMERQSTSEYANGHMVRRVLSTGVWSAFTTLDMYFKIYQTIPTIDLTGQTEIKFDLYASRTGSNIKLGIRNYITIDQQQTATDDYNPIYGATGTEERLAQSFVASGAISVYSVSINLVKLNTPTDNLILKIETDSSNLPSGTLVNANATKTIAAGSLSTGWNEFVFPATFTLSASTTYWIVVSRDGTRDTTNYFRWKGGSGAPYANGKEIGSSSGTWSDLTGYDAAFKVNRIGTTTEKTHTIAQANTWETDTWDISAVADADKNAIDRIIFTQVNADNDTTWYVDNFYTGTSNYTQALSETIVDTDTLLKKPFHICSDTTSISELVSKLPNKVCSEVTTYIDSILRVVNIIRSETVINTDTVIKSVFMHTLSEINTLSDVLSKLVGKQLSEVVAQSDTLLKLTKLVRSDTLVTLDTLNKLTSLVKSELVTNTDTLSKFVLKNTLEEVIAVSEVMLYWHHLSDNLTTWLSTTSLGSTWVGQDGISTVWTGKVE